MNNLNLLVTLSPSFPHFVSTANNSSISAIRFNSAMTSLSDLDKELKIVQENKTKCPIYYDVKGRQLRIEEVLDGKNNNLEIRLNHAIRVKTPIPVLFKAGADGAFLSHLEEGGKKLVFHGGPNFKVKPGESICIRFPSLEILGSIFTNFELQKIDKVKKSGFKKYFLSYVEKQSDIDQFLELVGKDSEIYLKIESEKGLKFVQNDFKKKDNLKLVAARGDLYVEIERPHHISKALKLIIEKDSEALVGSRILLSSVESYTNIIKKYFDALKNAALGISNVFYGNSNYSEIKEKIDEAVKLARVNLDPTATVPSCADFLELEWLKDIGYKNFMLCDEICLREDFLNNAIGAFDAFRNEL